MKPKQLVVVFGRTNVGKSTLFNTLTERKQAMVADFEGTTRDSNIGTVEWNKKNFYLVDTGGIMDLKNLFDKSDRRDDIETKVQKQARDYLLKANLILFVVDAKTGPLPQDRQMATALKKILPDTGKVIVVANKADGARERKELTDFYQLGLGEPQPISATSGSGTGDLLDLVVKKLRSKKISALKTDFSFEAGGKKSAKDDVIKVCLIGKPNVGKSSLVNALIGEDRVIVSPIAHTTREPQDTDLAYKDKVVRLIDTAGITRKAMRSGRQKLGTEKAIQKSGIDMSLFTLNKADIALFIWDVNTDIIHQDMAILSEIIERKKSLIIIANKWDLVPEKDTQKYVTYINNRLPFISWVPIQFVSAKTHEKVTKVLDLILEIAESRKISLSDSVLNTFMMKLVKLHRPTKGRGVHHPRIRKFFQAGSNPPRFEMRIGAEEDLHDSYVRFVENRLREKFGFIGTPISVHVVKPRKVHSVGNR